MKKSFKSLDETFNLPVENYNTWEELEEGTDYIRFEVKSCKSKKPSYEIKKKNTILIVKNEQKVVYQNNTSCNLKGYYNLIDEIIFEMLDEQNQIIKYKINDNIVTEKKEMSEKQRHSYEHYNTILKKEKIDHNKLKNIKFT